MNVSRHMKDKIVHCSNRIPDGFGGFTYETIQPILGRWQDTQEWFRNDKNSEQLSAAIVLTTKKVAAGDRLYLGSIGPDFSPLMDGVWEVGKVSQKKDVAGNVVMYKVWL